MNARAPLPMRCVSDEGELLIGGWPVSRLAARVGATPFYAVERAALTARVAQLRRVLPPAVQLHYALKANPMPALVGHMARLVDGLDVASAGELKTALDAGMPAQSISFAGPGKRAAELASALAAGVLVQLESAGELAVVNRESAALGVSARVAVRVNPDFSLKGCGMRMGGGARPFGVDAEQVPSLLKALAASGQRFEGFHLYWGSQNLSAEAICEAQRASFALALQLAEAAPVPPAVINLGGGFGIPYFPGERPLDLVPIARNLAQLQFQLEDRYPGAVLVIELGRYLVGEAGVYVCRVVDRKVSRGEVFLVTDGGLHHHLAASGQFGQVVRRNYPIALASRMTGTPLEKVSVVGPLCTPLDVLGAAVELPAAQIGDLIAVFQSGAYGLTASPVGFLSHPAPLEVLV
jgi:diaminopimelate decarboxylase